MRTASLALIAALACTATPALAEDGAGAQVADNTSNLQQKLSDPEVQEQMAGTVAVLGEMLLDLPIAPLARSMAEAGDGDPRAVDPDMTLRKYAPAASAVPGVAAKNLPRMMDAMAGMAGGLQAMMPALRGMAERMQGAMNAAAKSPTH